MHRRALLKTMGTAVPAAAISSHLRAVGVDDPPEHDNGGRRSRQPVITTDADWQSVADALGRSGKLNGGTVYRVAFPRRDLFVTSYGVAIKAGLSLGGYTAFSRYRDGKAMAMGDLVVTEPELPGVADALLDNGISLTGVHKHLLAHEPDLWWAHFHSIGDSTGIARGLRDALDQTTTAPPAPSAPPPPLDLDTAGIDAAFGRPGTNDGGIYKFSFARNETAAIDGRITLPAMGVSTALNFQPVGQHKAAINGDIVLTASEVQTVITALRRGGIQVVELHNHGLADQPRLFYLHFWSIDDGVALARTLAAAVHDTNVHPI